MRNQNTRLTLMDIHVLLRVVRAERDRLTETRMGLEERLATMGNGEGTLLSGEIALITNEISVLYGVVAKLWNMLGTKDV